MQRIFQSTLAKRSLLLAGACLLLTTCPAFAKENKGKADVESYGGCAAGTAVTLYTLQDERHTWPGGTKWAFWADEPSREISATDVTWEFFKDHPRRN
jgi:poly(3-hydroxybutyrate) depolymerase